MSASYFNFGTDPDTVKACFSIIERACRGELHAQKMARLDCHRAGVRRKVTKYTERANERAMQRIGGGK